MTQPQNPPAPAPPPSPWSPRQQQFVDRARDHALRLEAAAYAYRRAVGRIESLQTVLDGSSALLALWAMYAAWANSSLSAPGETQRRHNDIISVVGAGLSLIVLSLQLLSWRASWTPKAEKLRGLASEASAMSARFRAIIEGEKFDETVFKRTETELRAFEAEEAHPLAGVSRRFKQLGFQHVCQRHTALNIECTACHRKWDVLSKRLHSVWTMLRFWNCSNCGVSR